jgi:DNA-binding ferritin-like protein (Dps family)
LSEDEGTCCVVGNILQIKNAANASNLSQLGVGGNDVDIFADILKATDEKSRIRIHTKMSRIHNTASK